MERLGWEYLMLACVLVGGGGAHDDEHRETANATTTAAAAATATTTTTTTATTTTTTTTTLPLVLDLLGRSRSLASSSSSSLLAETERVYPRIVPARDLWSQLREPWGGGGENGEGGGKGKGKGKGKRHDGERLDDDDDEPRTDGRSTINDDDDSARVASEGSPRATDNGTDGPRPRPNFPSPSSLHLRILTLEMLSAKLSSPLHSSVPLGASPWGGGTSSDDDELPATTCLNIHPTLPPLPPLDPIYVAPSVPVRGSSSGDNSVQPAPTHNPAQPTTKTTTTSPTWSPYVSLPTLASSLLSLPRLTRLLNDARRRTPPPPPPTHEHHHNVNLTTGSSSPSPGSDLVQLLTRLLAAEMGFVAACLRLGVGEGEGG